MVEVQNLEQEYSVRCYQSISWEIYIKFLITINITLVPSSNRVAHISEIAHCSGKGQNNIILAAVIFPIGIIIECY